MYQLGPSSSIVHVQAFLFMHAWYVISSLYI